MPIPPRPDLARGLKLGHLRLLAALLATGQLGHAALRLGITQPAASRLLAECEALAGTRLHERRGRGLILTPAGLALARRAERVAIELSDAARDLAEAASGALGTVRVGAVTGPALSLVLPALRTLQVERPGLLAEVTVAGSEALCEALRAGQIDFALGRPTGDEGLLTAPLLAREPLALMVRAGHPLLSGGKPDAAALLAHDWVLPGEGVLLTQGVRARLAELGLPPPRVRIRTESFPVTLAILADSDAIAPLALPVAATVAGPGMPFAILPDDLGLTVAPFGLIRRAGSDLPPAARLLAEAIEAGWQGAGQGAVRVAGGG